MTVRLYFPFVGGGVFSSTVRCVYHPLECVKCYLCAQLHVCVCVCVCVWSVISISS